MSSIADALKRAQQERERMRGEGCGSRGARNGETGEPSLASVVLRKNAAENGAVTESPGAPEGRPATPVADAIRQAPVSPSPALRAQQQAAETIVEDYTSKQRLNLPRTLVVYHERAGTAAEQYRRIRDSLMAGNPKRDPQVLVFTSAMAGEGKTTTVANLGLSMVEIRANRVLLIDGCLAGRGGNGQRTLTELLKMQGERGLAEMLKSTADEAASFVRATPWHHLCVLPAGKNAEGTTAVELLKSPALGHGLRQLRSRFDWVLVDSPAALARPDAGLWGAASDGIIMAVAMHRTSQEKVRTTVRRLRSMNLPVKSCILTRA